MPSYSYYITVNNKLPRFDEDEKTRIREDKTTVSHDWHSNGKVGEASFC